MPEFEVEINGAAGSYSVAARSAAGETRAVQVRFPFDDLELGQRMQALELALVRSSATVRRLTSAEERPVQEFGRQLFEFIFPAELRAHLTASRQQAAQQGETLQVRLHVGPSELAALPWEFLYDPSRDEYLCLSAPLVRYLDMVEPRRPLTVTPPLRILAMVARPAELDSLDVDHERRRLTEALTDIESAGRVQLSWVRGQTWWHLQAALDQGDWHIFHFIGHGSLDSLNSEGVVAFAAEDGGVHRVMASDLALLLAEEQCLQLVVLNSCDTARASAADRFSSTAAMLMRRGIPAVVAMQYEISDPAAISFARGFYTALAAQHPVDVAVTRARRAIKISRLNTLEWATPVLYLRSPTGALFDLTDVSATPAAQLPPQPKEHEEQRAVAEAEHSRPPALTAVEREKPSALSEPDSFPQVPLAKQETFHPSASPSVGAETSTTQPSLEVNTRNPRTSWRRPPPDFGMRQGGETPGPHQQPSIGRGSSLPPYAAQMGTFPIGSFPTGREQSAASRLPDQGAPPPIWKSALGIAWMVLLWVMAILFGLFSLVAVIQIAIGHYQPLAGSIPATLFLVSGFVGSMYFLIRRRRKKRVANRPSGPDNGAKGRSEFH